MLWLLPDGTTKERLSVPRYRTRYDEDGGFAEKMWPEDHDVELYFDAGHLVGVVAQVDLDERAP